MRKVAILSVVVLLAACADTPSIVEPDRSIPSLSLSRADAPGQPHVLRTKDGANELRFASSPNGSKGTIRYHGGPVLTSATNVVAIYWSANTIYTGGPKPGSFNTSRTSGDGSLVGLFLRNLGGSPYFNINSTYSDGTGRHIANVVNYTGYWANTQSPLLPSGTQTVSDQQMLDMLSYGFQHGYLVYDPHTLYAILTEGPVNLGGGFGTSYCAYHWYGTVTTDNRGTQQTALYAAMPDDYAYPSACSMFASTPSPNGDPHADAVVNTLAHETEETTTDMFGTAWWDGRGYENADKCAWTFGAVSQSSGGAPYNMTLGGKNFLIQRNWVNASSGSGYCATSF
ncbi:MAG TPA: hypothetical protein VGH98_24925 [Gemmatimonadaceae bacterium]|jgi:hypothetical protein